MVKCHNIHRLYQYFSRLVMLVVVLSFGTVFAQDAAAGGKIFQARCTACHALDKKLVGPPLAGITDHRKEDWLIKWIHNSQALVKAGDPEAVKIFNEYNKLPMNSFEDLSEKDVKDILAYIKEGSGGSGGGGGETTAPLADAKEAAEGEKIFQARCTACHAIDKKVIGPALAGITDHRKEDWLIKWIHNSQALIKAGDADAIKIFNEYNKVPMSSFEDLSEKDIKHILAYIKNAGAAKKETSTTSTTTATTDANNGGGNTGLIVGILIFVALVLGGAIIGLINANRAKEGVDPITTAGIKAFLMNPLVLGLVGFIALVWGGTHLITSARSVGLHQNYQPAQPIAYSHKLHAGDLGINCVYCHVGAENGKSATIPSLNVCMNCHNYVEKGPKHGTKEIAKLKEAYEKGKPVEWVRIHNLPDFVYFNHKQHVVAGGQQCQTCHGPVETMEEVYQFSPLSMGWCINCHRQTEVDVNKNDYYITVHDEWVKKKADAKKEGREVRVTVSDLGGLDCAKCHY